MAYEYGVNLKLNAEKAYKDIDALLAKLKEMETTASKVKLNLNISGLSGSIEKQKQEFAKTLTLMQQAAQKLSTQQQLDAQKIAQAEDKTATQRLHNAQKIAQAEDRTTTQRLANQEKIRQAENKTASEAEKSAMEILKANEKVRQEKEKTRQTEQKTAQEREKTARSEQRTAQETIRTERDKVNYARSLFSLYQQINREREREEAKAQKVADAEKKAREEAAQRAEMEAEISRRIREQIVLAARQSQAAKAVGGFFNASTTLTTMGRRYNTIGRSANLAGNVLNNVSQSFYFLQNAASRFMGDLMSYAQRIGNIVVKNVEKIAETAFDQYKTLETAEIGFSNFFNGSPAKFVAQVRQEAERMPGVAASDLIRGIQYIAPLAGGNSQLALSSAEGVMKAILYSGNDVSSYGTNALQNLMQLASGNFTYADIRQMLRAMPTLPNLLAETATGGELLQNGAITTERMKAYIKKYGQAGILELFKEIGEESSASSIYDRYAATFSGVIEETGEILKNRWNDAMENSGLYSSLKRLIENLDKSGAIDKAMNVIGDTVARVVNFFSHENTVEDMKAWLNTIETLSASFKAAIRNVVNELGKTLGIFNANGSLNTAGIRQLTHDISEFIKGVVNGMGNGLRDVIGLVKNLKNLLGEDAIRKLGQAIGWLASPMGKVVGLTTKLAAGMTSLASGLASAISGISYFMSDKLGRIGTRLMPKIYQLLGGNNVGLESNNTAMTTALVLARQSTAIAPYSPSASVASLNAASSIAAINPTATIKALEVSAWNKIKVGIASMISKAINLIVNLIRGGLIATISIAAGQFVKSVLDITQVFGEATNGIKKFVSALSTSIAGFALIFSVTKSPLASAITGLVAGIVGYTYEVEQQKRALQASNNEKMRQELSEQTTKDIKSITDYIVDVYKAAGGALDIETEEGRTTYSNLKTWLENKIVKRDESGNITALDYGQFLGADGKIDPAKLDEAFALVANNLYQQKMNAALADYTVEDAFAKMAQSGSKINLDTDANARQRMYDFIVRNLLNGTDASLGGVYDYTQSQEKVIRDYLQTIGLDDLTTGALESLEAQEKALSTSIQPDTVKIKNTVDEIDDKLSTDVSPELAKVANATEGFETLLTQINNNVMLIAQRNGGDFSTFGFNGTQLGSGSGANISALYDAWKGAISQGNKSWSDIMLHGNSSVGGYSVKRSAEGFKKMISVFSQMTGFTSSDFSSDSTLAQNWRMYTTRERAAKAYGKDPNSNDDWNETYEKLMTAYNKIVNEQSTTDPSSNKYIELQNKLSAIESMANKLTAINPGDWVMLFWLQDYIESFSKAMGLDIDFRARGGLISPIFRANGGRGVDSVPAFLQPGEFVMRASSTSKAGLGVMDALNRGDLGSAARMLGSRFSNSWNNSRTNTSTVNNNQKTITNNVTVNNKTRAGRLNAYFSLANRLASSF